MLGNAVTLAALTTAAFYVIYKKLPRRTKKLLVKYNLVSDLFALLGTYALFGGTVTALIAGALVSVIISVLLHIANHPDDFEWLTDSMNVIKDLLEEGKQVLKDLNKSYVGAKESHAS